MQILRTSYFVPRTSHLHFNFQQFSPALLRDFGSVRSI